MITSCPDDPSAGTLLSLSAALGGAETVDDAVRRVVDVADAAFERSTVGVDEYDPVADAFGPAGASDATSDGDGGIPARVAERVRERCDDPSVPTAAEAAVDPEPREPLRAEALVPVGSRWVLRLGVTESNEFDEATLEVVEGIGANLGAALDRIDGRRERRRGPERPEFLNRGPLLFIRTRRVGGEAVVDSCNDRFLRRLGYERGDLEGEPLASLYADDSAADLRDGGYDDALSGSFEMNERTLVDADGAPVHTLLRAVPRRDGTVGTDALFVDVSERRAARGRLRRQRERLELTLAGTNTGITDWDLETDELLSDETFVDLIGRDVDTADTFFEEVIHPDDRNRVRRTVEGNLSGGEPTTTEYRIRTADDGTRWLRSRAVPECDDDGTPVRVRAIVTDISDEKAKERERRRNERRFRSLFEDPGMLVGLLDTDGTLLDVNATAMEYVEPTAAEVTGRPFAETPWWSHSEALQDDLRGWIRRAADGEYVGYDATHRTPDGSRRHMEGTVRPVTDAEGRVTSLLISGRDVTERETRKRELESFRRAVEEAADGVAVLDDGEYVYIDRTHVDMYGFDDKDDLLGGTWRRLYDDAEVARLEAEAFPALESDGHWRGSVTGSRPDGSTFPAELSLTIVEDGRLVCTVRDETERRARKRELELKERAMDEANVGIQITDPNREDNPLVYVNDGFVEQTGYTREEVLGRNSRLLQGDDRDQPAVETLRDAVAAEEPATVQLRNYRKGGEPYWNRLSITPVYDDGDLVNYIGIQQDVTDEVRRKKELYAERERFRLLTESVEEYAFVAVDEGGTIRTWNAGASACFGYDADAAVGTSVTELYPESDRPERLLQQARIAGESTDEGWQVRADGTEFYADVRYVSLEADDGAFRGYAMIVHDMTERRRQRRRTDRFVEESEDVILVTDADGGITYASGSAKRQFGHGPDALVGGNLFAYLHPDEREPAMTAFFECVEGSGSDTAECRMASPDGGWFNVDIRYRNMLDDDAVDGMLVYLRNVTEARERARRFEGIFNRTLQFTALLEPDGTVVEVNDAALEFGGFDRSEVVGTSFSEVSWWTHSETVHDEVRDAIGRAGDGEFVRYKTEVRGENGLATIDFSVKPVVDESGDVSELVAEGRNVTAREQHRRHLEVMQRVIRHNMRNDLTKLRGWAQLIAEEERADRRAERLETVERIVEKWAAMAERMRYVHQLLQGWGNRRHTMECETIVRDAVESVRPGTDDATIVVQAPSDVGSVRVPAPIRSAVRELVENAAASTEGATVEVELARPEEDWIDIRVRDDGPGLPEMEAEVLETGEETQLTHGLGLGLWTVRMVVTQAGGTASVESSTDGTEVRLRLPATHDGRMQPSIGMPE